jgi:hypothetical protein
MMNFRLLMLNPSASDDTSIENSISAEEGNLVRQTQVAINFEKIRTGLTRILILTLVSG